MKTFLRTTLGIVTFLLLVPFSLLASTGGVSAVAGSGAVVVYFPVTGTATYTVVSSPGDFSASKNSSPISIGGLTNGVAYTFSVTRDDGTASALVGISDSVTPSPSADMTKVDISSQFQLKNPLGSANGTFKTFLDNVLNGIVILMTPVLVIMLLYSGYLFVEGQGNTEKLTDAKRALFYTIIGAAIVLASSGLAHVIQNTLTAVTG